MKPHQNSDFQLSKFSNLLLPDFETGRRAPIGITNPSPRRNEIVEDENEDDLPYEFRRKSKRVRSL